MTAPVAAPRVRTLTPLVTLPATLTMVGEGRCEMTMGDVRVALPVRLPSQEQVLGGHLYQPVVLTLSTSAGAPLGNTSDDPMSLEEDLAWHRSEVVRLREVLRNIEAASGSTSMRFEMAQSFICVTCSSGEDAEKTLAHALVDWLKSRGVQNEEVFAEMQTLRQRAYHAEALAALLAQVVSLPSEGKRLGPGPCALLQKLAHDEAVIEACDASLNRYLKEHRDEMLQAGHAVDAGEWGGGKGKRRGRKGEQMDLPLGDDAEGEVEITQEQFNAWLDAIQREATDPNNPEHRGMLRAASLLLGEDPPKGG